MVTIMLFATQIRAPEDFPPRTCRSFDRQQCRRHLLSFIKKATRQAQPVRSRFGGRSSVRRGVRGEAKSFGRSSTRQCGPLRSGVQGLRRQFLGKSKGSGRRRCAKIQAHAPGLRNHSRPRLNSSMRYPFVLGAVIWRARQRLPKGHLKMRRETSARGTSHASNGEMSDILTIT